MSDLHTLSQKTFKLSELDSKSISSVLSSNSLFQLSIDLGDGRKETLTINDKENPELQAIEFCQQHKLGPAVKIAICDELEQIFSKNEVASTQSPISVTLMKNPESSSPMLIKSLDYKKFSNIGERLYVKGIQMKEKVENLNQIRRENYLNELGKDLTFTPLTNSPLRRGVNIEEMLIFKGKQRNEKIRRKKSQKNSEIMASCTFSPEINKNKVKSTARLKRFDETFDTLYRDAEVIREKQVRKKFEIQAKECPFEPDLRLTRKQNEKISLRKAQNNNFSKNFSSSASPRKRNLSNEKSEKILLKLKQTRYLNIFQGLLPDSMGYISKETVYKSNLPSSTLKVLNPLIKELVELDEVLNFSEFYESMEILMRYLSPTEKNIILATSKPKPAPNLTQFNDFNEINTKECEIRLFPSPARTPVRAIDLKFSS